MSTLAIHPPLEPHDTGMLDVGDGQRVYWEVCGNPDGKPMVGVHGGPGSGCSPGWRQMADPEHYRIVLFDQRGCGRSTPHAADPATSLATNTTAHLLADMERLREHLGIERWLVFGASWGSTLGLAYAQAHPERVSELILLLVTSSRRAELEWLYDGVGRFFPAERDRFRAASGVPDADVFTRLAAFGQLMADPDPDVRYGAAREWAAWEDAVLSLEPHGPADGFSGRPDDALLAMCRICAHYFSHAAWLDNGVLVRGAGRLAGIPGRLIHGRFDISGPPDTAYELSRAWPGATLELIADAGHKGSPAMGAALDAAFVAFARAN